MLVEFLMGPGLCDIERRLLLLLFSCGNTKKSYIYYHLMAGPLVDRLALDLAT